LKSFGEVLLRERGEAGGVVLEHRRDGDDGHVVGAGEGHVLLETDAEIGGAAGDGGLRVDLARLDYLHVEPGILEIALLLGHEDAGVVGVGHPVQHQRDRGEFLRFGGPAGGQCSQGGGQ
jgi:hypothetical protein